MEGSMEEDNTQNQNTNRWVVSCATLCSSASGMETVLRRVIMVWMATMYTDQALKDLLKVPWPAYLPAVHLDSKWEVKYDLPSTHAMVGTVMPLSIFILSLSLSLSLKRYQIVLRYGET